MDVIRAKKSPERITQGDRIFRSERRARLYPCPESERIIIEMIIIEGAEERRMKSGMYRAAGEVCQAASFAEMIWLPR